MYDVIVQAPGGGWATDATGPLSYCRTRARDLRASNRRPKAVFRVIDRRTGARVTV